MMRFWKLINKICGGKCSKHGQLGFAAELVGEAGRRWRLGVGRVFFFAADHIRELVLRPRAPPFLPPSPHDATVLCDAVSPTSLCRAACYSVGEAHRRPPTENRHMPTRPSLPPSALAAPPPPPQPASSSKPPSSAVPAKKGFGKNQPPPKMPPPPPAPRVDRAAAARGRVDVATVASWAGGTAADVGDLRVTEFRPDPGRPRGRGAGGAGAGAAASTPPASSSSSSSPSYYDTLARTLGTLHASGALEAARAAAPATTAPPRRLPPFEAWGWDDGRYAAYVGDLAAVHGALDSALEAVARAVDEKEGGDVPPLATALLSLGPASGLLRGAAAAADATALNAPPPSPAAAAAARLLVDVGRAAAAAVAENAPPATTTRPRKPPPLARLYAHAYAFQIAHLTTGARVGAAAVEALGLFAKGAVSLYRDYPPSLPLATAAVTADRRTLDPLRAFRAAVDAGGVGLGEGDRAAVDAALPAAVAGAADLMEGLAVE